MTPVKTLKMETDTEKQGQTSEFRSKFLSQIGMLNDTNGQIVTFMANQIKMEGPH